MYRVLIVEPQEFSKNNLLNLPVWEKQNERRQGFTCVNTASNGKEALELINADQFDLILTEINLSILDGLQLLKKIHKSNQPPLVVFISDIVTFSYAREGFIYGAFDYLPKPVSPQDIEQLFDRAAEELERFKKVHPPVTSNIMNPRFAPSQINRVLEDFSHRNRSVLNTFHNMIRQLYESNEKAQQNPDLLASKLFSSIIDGIYTHNSWLALYIPQNFHEQIDYFELYNPNDYIDFYMRKFAYLFEQYCELNPHFDDTTITKIHIYLLEHPEEDLSLTTIAGKFFMNHTYLSSLFSKKSHLRYSHLVTMVKMKRAEYLINYTVLSLEDIALQLRYKDFRYFLNIFKKTIGKSATDYIRNEYEYSNYSI